MFPLELTKYQCCALDDCTTDATSQIIGVQPHTGTAYYMGACNADNHANIVGELKRWIEWGASVQDFPRLNKGQLFVCPLGQQIKFKYDPTEARRTAGASWQWEYRPQMWSTMQGKRKKIIDLTSDMIINAVLAIVGANFQRRSSRTQWTTLLPVPQTYYIYRKDQLQVGHREAHDKLEEFYHAAVLKDLIPSEKNPSPS